MNNNSQEYVSHQKGRYKNPLIGDCVKLQKLVKTAAGDDIKTLGLYTGFQAVFEI